MKNYIKLFILLLLSINASAQKTQVLLARNAVGKLQASIANKQDAKNQLAVITEGLKATEAAQKDNKTKNWAEVWAIKAYLTSYAVLIETDASSSNRYYDLANDALKQAKTLDKFENNSSLIRASYHNIIIKKQDRGNNSFFNNNFSKAFEDLKDVSDFFQKDTTLALNVGICALNIQNYDNAIKYLQRAKENGIKSASVFQKLSQLYISKFDNETALKTLEEGLALNPFSKSLTNDLINLLLDTENYTKASSLIENSLKAEKGNKLLYFLYGYLHQLKGNSSTAILAYDKALDLDQNYFDSLYQLGIAYIDQANETISKNKENKYSQYKSLINRAEFAFVKANEINPNDRQTIKLLADIYTKKGDLNKAQELNRRLNEL